MAKKKKKKIRWSGVALLVAIFAGILVGLYYLLSFVGGIVVGWFTSSPSRVAGADSTLAKREIVVAPKLSEQDSILAARLEKLVTTTPRIDTTRMAVSLYDATAKHYIYEFHPKRLLTPASCMKVPTAIAALEILGDDYTYDSYIKVKGSMHADTLVGDLLLSVSDDPLLTSLDSLVLQLHDAGIAVVKGQLNCLINRHDMLSAHPSSMRGDIPHGRLPLLLRGKDVIEPSFRASLKRAGIDVVGNDTTVLLSHVEDTGWREVASWHTPLRNVLTPMLIHSSNIKAEAVFYHLDKHEGQLAEPVMDWDAKHAVRKFWRHYFIGDDNSLKTPYIENYYQGVQMLDGSGLSPDNRLTTHLLVEMLLYAWERPHIRDYFINEALASPGNPTRRGSLTTRMAGERFRDRIFVKTGTLATKGVSSLSGYIHAPNNHWYIFCIINQKTAVAEGRLFQDEFCKLMVNQK